MASLFSVGPFSAPESYREVVFFIRKMRTANTPAAKTPDTIRISVTLSMQAP